MQGIRKVVSKIGIGARLGSSSSLRTEELREALSVVPGNTLWNRAKLLNDVYSAIASCGSLVIVDGEGAQATTCPP